MSRKPHQASAPRAGAERLRDPDLCMLAAAMGLFAARLAFAPESAALFGDGQLLVVAWLALAAAWLIVQARRPDTGLRWSLVDTLLAALLGWHTLAGLVALRFGAPRPALNMLWEWLGLGAAYFVVRQTAVRASLARAAVAAALGVALLLSFHAIHQVVWGFPQARAEYQQNPEKELRAAEVAAGTDRYLYEQRLASPEPFATFSLTNSLAGYLVAWGVAGLAAAAATGFARRPAREWAGLLAVVGCLAIALLFTKSRSGYLATFASLFALGLFAVARGWNGKRVAAVALGLLLGGAVVVAGLASIGVLDREILTEARKSLGYRWEYWRSTTLMIWDHPWFGCGPGNFQGVYARYKLPQASETVADPHNFLFEAAATAGLPAAVLLLGAILAVTWRVVRRPERAPAEEKAVIDADPRWIVFGAAVGFALSWLLGPWVFVPPMLAYCLAGAVVIGGVGALLWPWIDSGRLTAGATLLAAAALCLNLMAAGALAFPSLTASLLVLIALSVNLSGTERRLSLPAKTHWLLAGGAAILALLCWTTTAWPGFQVRQLTAGARDAMARGEGAQAENLLLAAAAADPRAVDSWMGLAELRFQRWRQAPTAAHWTSFQSAAQRMLALNPRSAPAWSNVGLWHMAAFRQGEPGALTGAVEAFRKAVELYPNHALGHANLAWALSLAGDSSGATTEANRALELDGLNPHQEQKLSRQVIADPQISAAETAEQTMRRLAPPNAAN
jgi:O-antigen ligase/Tfp pilus assembly protein PilF